MDKITPDKIPFIIAVALIALVTIIGLYLVNRRDEKELEENFDDPKQKSHRPPNEDNM